MGYERLISTQHPPAPHDRIDFLPEPDVWTRRSRGSRL
jgi:hypothetical protein